MQEHPAVTAFATAAVVVSATFAYFASPVLEFADPGTVLNFGMATGVGAGGAWTAFHGDWGRRWEWLFLLCCMVGLAGLTWQVIVGTDNLAVNRSRCEIIQFDMFSGKPLRADGPELFQALGCKPSRAGSLTFPARREVAD